MIKQAFICAVILQFFSVITNGQEIYKPGYIVTGADTLRGYLKEDVEANLVNGVSFSSNISGNANRFYTPADMNAFYFTGGNMFRLVKFTDSKKQAHQYFVKYLLKGYFDVFSFRKADELYFIVANKDSAFFLYNDKYLTTGYLDEKGNYKQQLLFLSVGCEHVSDLLENLQYNEKSLISFIRKLNTCHEPAAKSTVLYVKPKSKMNLYVYAGGLPLGHKWEYTARALVRFTFPSINKNTSLNAGIVYMSQNQDEPVSSVKNEHTINIISGGVTLQYNLLTGRIQPYVEAGLGFAHQQDNSPIVSDFQSKSGVSFIIAGGVEGFITKNFVIKADWRYELLTQYPVIGIAYFFK